MRRFSQLRCLRPYALLVLLCLLLYLPGTAAIPLLDRDEARFAQSSRQMLQTGDFLRIRFQDEARNNKPPGIYWLQALAVAACSTAAANAIWPYRLPSLLGAMLAALLTFAGADALFRDHPQHRRLALFAAVLVASALGVVAEAHIGKTDASLLAATTAAQVALGLTYVRMRGGRAVSARIAALFWGAEIVAIYLKGPVAPGLTIVTAASLSIADRDSRWLYGLRPFAGLAAVVAAVVPWLVAIQNATAGHFLDDSLGHDFFLKLAGARESHGAPPLSYLMLGIVTFWPGSLLLARAGALAWRRRDAPAERFLIAWLLPAWLLLELVPTKLPHYILPVYPALAMLCARALADGLEPAAARWLRRLDVAVRVLWAAATAALAAALVVVPRRFGGEVSPAGIAGAALVLGLAVALLRWRPASDLTTVLLAVAALAFVVPAGAAVLPRLDALWLSRSAAALVGPHPVKSGEPLVAVGYSEPSLVFLLGGKLRFLPPDAAVAALKGGGEVLVSDHDDLAFRQGARARGVAAQALGHVGGIDYSNGRRIVLTLYAVAPG